MVSMKTMKSHCSVCSFPSISPFNSYLLSNCSRCFPFFVFRTFSCPDVFYASSIILCGLAQAHAVSVGSISRQSHFHNIYEDRGRMLIIPMFWHVRHTNIRQHRKIKFINGQSIIPKCWPYKT